MKMLRWSWLAGISWESVPADRGIKVGQRGAKLNCSKASANPVGKSGVYVVYQSWPLLAGVARPLYSCLDPSSM